MLPSLFATVFKEYGVHRESKRTGRAALSLVLASPGGTCDVSTGEPPYIRQTKFLPAYVRGEKQASRSLKRFITKKDKTSISGACQVATHFLSSIPASENGF